MLTNILLIILILGVAAVARELTKLQQKVDVITSIFNGMQAPLNTIAKRFADDNRKEIE